MHTDLSLMMLSRVDDMNEKNALHLAEYFYDIVEGDEYAASKAKAYLNCMKDCGLLRGECWIAEYDTEYEFFDEHVVALSEIESKFERRMFLKEMEKLIAEG